MRWKSMFQYLHLMLRRRMTMEEHLIITDTMVCTGCCATLDHIVTYLFKKVTNKGRYQTQIGTMLNLVASYSWKESARISNLGWKWPSCGCDQGGQRCFAFFGLWMIVPRWDPRSFSRCCRQCWTSSCLRTAGFTLCQLSLFRASSFNAISGTSGAWADRCWALFSLMRTTSRYNL